MLWMKRALSPRSFSLNTSLGVFTIGFQFRGLPYECHRFTWPISVSSCSTLFAFVLQKTLVPCMRLQWTGNIWKSENPFNLYIARQESNTGNTPWKTMNEMGKRNQYRCVWTRQIIRLEIEYIRQRRLEDLQQTMATESWNLIRRISFYHFVWWR